MFALLHGAHPDVDTVIITGGRNSQKSFAVGTWACIGAKDFEYNTLYTRYTLTSAEDSIIPEFSEKIELLGAEKYFNVKSNRIDGINKSKIVFKGVKTSSGNQTAGLKSLKNFNVFILEEAEEMPDFDTWDKVKKSIRSNTKRNLSILILNPTTKTHWIYEEFFEDRAVNEGWNGVKGNVMYIHSSYLDMDAELVAPNLLADFEDKRLAYEEWIKLPKNKRDISPLKKKAKYYKHTVLGGWLEKSEGVIFENWEIGDYEHSDYELFGQDYGFSNDPTTLARVHVCKKRKKIFIKEECYQTRMKTDDVYEVMNEVCGGTKVVGDSAEPRLITELYDRGINIVPAIKGAGSIKEGIAFMLDYDLIVDPSSENLIKELNNYSWSNKKSGTPIDAHNHLIDAIRYAVSEFLTQPEREISFGWDDED